MAIYQDPLPNHQQQQAQPQQPPQQQQNQTANINTIFTDEELSPKRWKPSPGPNWEREESPVEWLEPVPKDESMRNQVTLEEPATTHIAVNDACNPNATRLRPPQAANASSPAPRVRYAPPQSPTSPLRASSTPVLRPPTNPPSSPTPILKPIKSILQLSTIATPAEASTSLRASPSTQSTISDESACTMQPEAPRRCHANHKGWQAVKQDPAADVHTGAVSDEEATPMEERF